MEAVLCGHGLGVGPGKEADHGVSARDAEGPPPGETWGGRGARGREVLPSIRKGSTMLKAESSRVRPGEVLGSSSLPFCAVLCCLCGLSSVVERMTTCCCLHCRAGGV